MSIEKPSLYELQTHEGRKIEEAADLGMGYCGSCSLDIHIKQLDGGLYDRAAKDWFKAYVMSLIKITIG